MKQLPSSYLEPKIFDNKYFIEQNSSSELFRIVYLAIHKETHKEVVVKLKKDRKVYLLNNLKGIQDIAKLYIF